MTEISSTNPIYPKIISRNSDNYVDIGESREKLEYTSSWEDVEGAMGVKCRTWKLEGPEKFVDGADIRIEKGGFTPIQLVNSADAIVDTLEFGKGYACVMMADGKIYTTKFSGSEKQQMVWEQGMLICWVAEEDSGLTEFESPAFKNDMFINITDDMNKVPGFPELDLEAFRKEVNKLKKLVNKS